MTNKSSRYIPKEVQRQLREISRDRCCVCGHLISFDEISLEIERDILHQHHIIYFSEGGENSAENLLVVCPSCHAKIHARPQLYPHEKLKESKRHWAQMKQLVSSELLYEPDDMADRGSDTEISLIKFYIATLNLEYQITVPSSVQMGALSRFISSWIMHPLVTFASLAPYNFMFGQAQLRRLGLALKSEPRIRLSTSTRLSDLNIHPDDALIALVDFEWVALMPGREEEEEDGLLFARVTLTWNDTPRDLDLHLIPVGRGLDRHTLPQLFGRRTEVFYGNLGSLSRFPWARLNTDIRTGYGPEVISIGLKARGSYLVAVHNYSGESVLSGSDAIVRIELGNKPLMYHCPRSGDGKFWNVCLIDCDTETVEIIDSLEPVPVS